MVNEVKNDDAVARRDSKRDHEYGVRALRDIRDSFLDPTFDPMWEAFGVRTPSLFRLDPFRGLGDLEELREEQDVRVYDEADGGKTVVVDLPGYQKKDLTLSWPDDHTFSLTASERHDDENHSYRESKTITRQFTQDMDVEHAEAKFEDGVLTVKLAPAEPVEPTAKTTEIK